MNQNDANNYWMMNGEYCPNCNGTKINAMPDWETEGLIASRTVVCEECGHSFVEDFVMVGIADKDGKFLFSSERPRIMINIEAGEDVQDDYIVVRLAPPQCDSGEDELFLFQSDLTISNLTEEQWNLIVENAQEYANLWKAVLHVKYTWKDIKGGD